MLSGSKLLLNFFLRKLNLTDQKKEAFEEIQQCYNEGGLKTEFLDATVVVTSYSIPHAHMVQCCVQGIHETRKVFRG